jgi:endonuclease/exonuclease/phosphatase family metal-dependent hydrolase
MAPVRLLALLALAGCVDVANDGTSWQDIATITGELAPEQGPAPPPRAVPATLRIATFNVHFADDVDNLAAQIASSTYLATADVLFVQEIRRYTSEPSSRAERLATALGMTWVYAPAHTVDNGGVHGVAILSRFPLAGAQVRQLPYFDQINTEQRIALRADVMLDGVALPAVDVHLDTRLAPADRIYQLDPALHDVADRMIIGGDLNTLPWVWVDSAVPLMSTNAVVGQEQAKIVDDFFAQNHFEKAVDFDVDTTRAPGFSLRLDDLYARELPVLAGAVEHVDGSDHWPVWFDLAWGSLASQ